MSDKQETIADIIAEMRERKIQLEDAIFNAPLCYSTDDMRAKVEILDEFLDRLEAAHEREVEAARREPRTCEECVEGREKNGRRMAMSTESSKETTAEKSSAGGNAAKLREALEELVANIEMRSSTFGLNAIVDTKTYLDAKSALAEPPRQCDVGTAEEQVLRWRGFCACEKGGVCDGCPCLANDGGVEACYAKWSQMPYEEGVSNAE